MKKGFTLIELLAVIVILAIIALIATPMILGVIETARKGAAKTSALGYLDAVEKQIMINQLDSLSKEFQSAVILMVDALSKNSWYKLLCFYVILFTFLNRRFRTSLIIL